MRSYTIELKRNIDEADGSLLGVQLGKLCLENNIPVSKIASAFGVSRMTVYTWFKGEVKPRASKAAKIQEFIDKLTNK
jgi:predicted transcriptional regulator